MLPTIFPGDTLIIERVNAESTDKGDIVLVGRDGRLFAHRLLDKHREASFLQTRGDSMPQPDPPVSECKLLGRVSFIIRRGRAIEPRRKLRFPQRAVAALVQRSEIAARVVVGVHGLRSAARIQEP